jgi:cobalamin biosynthesis Co2+ chelatase CbiK
MSMQALNRLVARSIIDPTVLHAFGSGHIGEVLSDLDFSPEMRRTLSGLEAESWAEFAVQAYRVVKAAEQPAVRVELPSPLEGLIEERDTKRADFGQVA